GRVPEPRGGRAVRWRAAPARSVRTVGARPAHHSARRPSPTRRTPDTRRRPHDSIERRARAPAWPRTTLRSTALPHHPHPARHLRPSPAARDCSPTREPPRAHQQFARPPAVAAFATRLYEASTAHEAFDTPGVPTDAGPVPLTERYRAGH